MLLTPQCRHCKYDVSLSSFRIWLPLCFPLFFRANTFTCEVMIQDVIDPPCYKNWFCRSIVPCYCMIKVTLYCCTNYLSCRHSYAFMCLIMLNEDWDTPRSLIITMCNPRAKVGSNYGWRRKATRGTFLIRWSIIWCQIPSPHHGLYLPTTATKMVYHIHPHMFLWIHNDHRIKTDQQLTCRNKVSTRIHCGFLWGVKIPEGPLMTELGRVESTTKFGFPATFL